MLAVVMKRLGMVFSSKEPKSIDVFYAMANSIVELQGQIKVINNSSSTINNNYNYNNDFLLMGS